MSEASIILDAIDTQFKASSDLDYISNFGKAEDEYELEDEKKFPFLNIDITELRVTEADNMNLKQMERYLYPVVITFSVRNKRKNLVRLGSSSFKGLWDIYDDIVLAIEEDRTFGGAVNKVPYKPEVATSITKYLNQNFWIGRGAMIFEVYKDIFKV